MWCMLYKWFDDNTLANEIIENKWDLAFIELLIITEYNNKD